jgi:ferricrocin synthase
LEGAWNKLVQVLPILRTYFVAGSGEPSILQVVLKHDTAISNGVFNQQILLPATLTARSIQSGILLSLPLHHALNDGVSLPGMISLFQTPYNQPGLTPSISPFEEYIYHQSLISQKSHQREFWTPYLKDGFPTITPSANALTTPRTHLYMPSLIPTEALSEIIPSLCAQGLSIQALFLGAYPYTLSTTLLHPQPPKPPLIIGLYLTNRYTPSTLSLLAPTLTIIPLLLPIPSSPTPASLYAAARAIQEDLGKVSAPEVAVVSLAEIREWTDVRVESFVNFLRVPDGDSGEGEDESGDGMGRGRGRCEV